jgi:hypothetical protein
MTGVLSGGSQRVTRRGLPAKPTGASPPVTRLGAAAETDPGCVGVVVALACDVHPCPRNVRGLSRTLRGHQLTDESV